jgi:hypothetical protein
MAAARPATRLHTGSIEPAASDEPFFSDAIKWRSLNAKQSQDKGLGRGTKRVRAPTKRGHRDAQDGGSGDESMESDDDGVVSRVRAAMFGTSNGGFLTERDKGALVATRRASFPACPSFLGRSTAVSHQFRLRMCPHYDAPSN